MKVSGYNFFVPSSEGGIIFNAAEGTFTKVNGSTFSALKRKQIPELPQEYLDELLASGILEDGRQVSRIRSQFELRKFSGTHVNITIAPTIECNLSCWYCYQNERRHFGVMSQETQNATLRFIEAATLGKQTFNVDWFGGEPLLAEDLISRLTTDIKKGDFGKARYVGGSIITNGLLLNDANVAMLMDGGIQQVQVSVDRLRHSPPKHRGLLMEDGRPSPILENILRYSSRLKVFIRINVSNLPDGELAIIEDELRMRGLRENAYLARVEDNIAECSGPGRAIQGGLTRKAFAKAKGEFGRGTQAYLDMMQKALTPKVSFCGATSGSLYVIDHRGDISRCFISAGVSEEKIGNVNDLTPAPAAHTTEADQRWKTYSPFNYESCVNCRVLPLCMGGCSHARVLHGAIRPPCESIKHNINRYVREIGARLPDNHSLGN